MTDTPSPAYFIVGYPTHESIDPTFLYEYQDEQDARRALEALMQKDAHWLYPVLTVNAQDTFSIVSAASFVRYAIRRAI